MTEKSSQLFLIPDTDLLALFNREPERAWQVFTHKYSDLIFSALQRLGFDYDEAMDRFVFIFEKLSEQNFRRLKAIRHTGSQGEITPWLLTVVQNLSVSWLRSVEGRKRILKSIARLTKHDRRVFELYFWKGYSPSLIVEHIKLEGTDTELSGVLESLERIFTVLTDKKRWRLLSNLLKTSRNVSLDASDEETGISLQLPDPEADPEEKSIEKEAQERMQQAIQSLSTEEQLLIQLRYVDGASLKQLSSIFHSTEKSIQDRVATVIQKLRQRLEPRGTQLSVVKK